MHQLHTETPLAKAIFELFESVAQDALDYYAIPKPLELNIKHALRELRKL